MTGVAGDASIGGRAATERVLRDVDDYARLNRHSERSFVRDVLAGRSSTSGLRRWAVQKFHQVYEQNRVFSAIHSKSEHEAVRQFMVQQLISEETDICDGSASHYELMERFAIALGASRREVRETRPAPAVMRFVDFLLGLAHGSSVFDCLLAISINESQAQESAELLYRCLRDRHQLTDRDLEWFIVHGKVDKAHAASGRDRILRYADPGFPDRALDVARRGCAEWLRLHDFYAEVHEGGHGDGR